MAMRHVRIFGAAPRDGHSADIDAEAQPGLARDTAVASQASQSSIWREEWSPLVSPGEQGATRALLDRYNGVLGRLAAVMARADGLGEASRATAGVAIVPGRSHVFSAESSPRSRILVPLATIQFRTTAPDERGAELRCDEETTPAALATALSDAELKFVLAHELAHLHRDHALANALSFYPAVIALGLLPMAAFPVACWLGYRVRSLHEKEADAMAVAALDACGLDGAQAGATYLRRSAAAEALARRNVLAAARMPLARRLWASLAVAEDGDVRMSLSHPPTSQRLAALAAPLTAGDRLVLGVVRRVTTWARCAIHWLASHAPAPLV